MSLYSPYEVISSSDKILHLQESKGRKIFMFIFFRIFPFILAAMVLNVRTYTEIPIEFRQILSVGVLLIGVLFLLKVYVTEVLITRNSIDITSNIFFFPRQRTFLLNDVEKITVKMVRGKGGGMFYRLKLKERRTVSLFTIPVLYMKKEKLPLINEQLSKITGMEVEVL